MEVFKRKAIFIEVSLLSFFLITIFITYQLFSESGNVSNSFMPVLIDNSIFPYELTNPSYGFKLPHYLDEISGISYIEHNKLACIQDEKGIIYLFDIELEKVIDKYKFGSEKDYEDIEIVNKTVYILQSNGNILKIEDLREKDSKVKRYKTPLSKKNDTEGMAFDNESSSLLIACKASPNLDSKNNYDLKGKRAIYRFDLNSKKLTEKPVYTIDLRYFKDLKLYNSYKKPLIEFKKFLNSIKNVDFRPSGIAVHPITKDIYIISSADEILIVLDHSGGNTISVKRLKKSIFKQPEGICFSPNGDLFISNESKDGRANILKFKYKKPVSSFL